MRKVILLFALVSFCFLIPAKAQFWQKVQKAVKRGGGHVINLSTTYPTQAKFSGLPDFALKFEDKRSSTNILQKYDSKETKPDISTNVEPFEFVKAELGHYMSQLGFSCSQSSSSEILLIVTLDKFDVGYYSGKGWAANISLGLALVNHSGEEYYVKEINKERVQINSSSSDFNIPEKALNNAWNSLLENKIEWQVISGELQRVTTSKPVSTPVGTQIVNVTNVYNQQVIAPASEGNTQSTPSTPSQRKLSDVDENIPIAESNTNSNTFVLIIANENYKDLQKVNYALSDAETFREYCIKTLGVPQKQIFYLTDATYGEMGKSLGKLEYVLNEFDGKRVIVYYCGHGTNDESTGKAYIVPVDGDAKGSAFSYSMEEIYKSLSQTKAASITYFLDACFSGASRDGGMLIAARGTARAPKKDVLAGNTIVFSATKDDETAMAYDDKKHGLFTYYLLKALQESKGDITYENLYDYISVNVKNDAFLINEKPQHPMIFISPAAQDSWRNMKLK